MRTVKDIKLEIITVTDRLQNEDLKQNAISRLKKQLHFYKAMILYLETSPNLEYIKLEIKSLEGKINTRLQYWNDSDYSNLTKPQVSKLRKEFEKEWEIPKLRDQIKALRYILK